MRLRLRSTLASVCLFTACFPKLETADPCTEVTCGADELCDPLDGSCYPEDGTCNTAEDCREGHTCIFIGLCAGCSGTPGCRPGQNCVLGTCIPER